MHFKDMPSSLEDAYDVPSSTIEPIWRFLQDNHEWCYRRALSGTPIAFRYRRASNRLGMLNEMKRYRELFYADYPNFNGQLKLVSKWPYYLVIMLKDDTCPMSKDEVDATAPMDEFYRWHNRHFQGSGRHEDPSRPAPTPG